MSAQDPPAAPEDYLARLGARVRAARGRRGLSRKALAREADVSERYLAQLEAGTGNCSIALLLRVAQALGIPLEDLVRTGPEPAAEARLLARTLERLPPQALQEAQALLQRHFGRALKVPPRDRIALIGLRGAGKSTLGPLLAERLGLPFVELDREIERERGMTLAEMFELFGQERFRAAERAALERLLASRERMVLATGGGIVTEPATFELLLASCFTVWLRAAPQEHMARVIAQGDLRVSSGGTPAMDDLIRLLAAREPLYARADATVVTTARTPEQSADEVLGALGARASLGG